MEEVDGSWFLAWEYLAITDTGGTKFYYDRSLNTPRPNSDPFFEISLRELSY